MGTWSGPCSNPARTWLQPGSRVLIEFKSCFFVFKFKFVSLQPVIQSILLTLYFTKENFFNFIFGADMCRDDGHYCDVLSSRVNLFLVIEVSGFYSIHWLFIVWDLECKLAASYQYTSNTLCIAVHGCQQPKSTNQQLVQHWKERQGSNYIYNRKVQYFRSMEEHYLSQQLDTTNEVYTCTWCTKDWSHIPARVSFKSLNHTLNAYIHMIWWIQLQTDDLCPSMTKWGSLR